MLVLAAFSGTALHYRTTVHVFFPSLLECLFSCTAKTLSSTLNWAIISQGPSWTCCLIDQEKLYWPSEKLQTPGYSQQNVWPWEQFLNAKHYQCFLHPKSSWGTVSAQYSTGFFLIDLYITIFKVIVMWNLGKRPHTICPQVCVQVHI